ncbi:hypothetical protein CF392_06570 [Tamilnaduibacter salinus]|uniref:Ancillary SecYEG translocon subunit n=1 Tax=Tamilnaduibacter salinus TaxID=1484056 RepID=A0A2A2I2L2_9GAMM|nr:tetratricopeptide repeat protein [Tamilnaduibacter salinus]PAV26261.1 hypothetical protein CF392_06570 [Tamilnaduibacter salinus]
MQSEEEQIATIKNWWKRNGTSLLLGVGLALALVFGWQAWQQHQAEQMSAAGSQYQQLLTAATKQQPTDKDAETIRYVAETLRNDFADTPYAVYGTLILAGHQVTEQGKPEAAADSLKWALSRAESGPLKLLVRQRLAQAQFAAEQPDAALATLNEAGETGAFTALYAELEGDILRAQGNAEEAREAYKRASEAASGPTASPMLQLKMADMAIPEDA